MGDFRQRFVALLGYNFRNFPVKLALNFLSDSIKQNSKDNVPISFKEMSYHMTRFDLKRLESYTHNLVDWHMILDMIPALARLFFLNRLPLNLAWTQTAILLGLGLQHKTVT